MKIEELFIGAWVQELSPTVKKLTPPMRVVGLFKGTKPENDMAYLEMDGSEGDPWECKVKDLRGILVTEEMLLKNRFKKTNGAFSVVDFIRSGITVHLVNRARLQDWLSVDELGYIMMKFYRGCVCVHDVQRILLDKGDKRAWKL